MILFLDGKVDQLKEQDFHKLFEDGEPEVCEYLDGLAGNSHPVPPQTRLEVPARHFITRGRL